MLGLLFLRMAVFVWTKNRSVGVQQSNFSSSKTTVNISDTQGCNSHQFQQVLVRMFLPLISIPLPCFPRVMWCHSILKFCLLILWWIATVLKGLNLCGGDQLSTESDNKTPSWKKRARLCSSSPISGATQTRCRRMKVESTEMKVNWSSGCDGKKGFKIYFNSIGRGCMSSQPNIMNPISWNCWGLKKPRTVCALQQLVKDHHTNILFVMETKSNRRRMVNLLSRFGVINVSTVVSMGGYSCGGLAL